jgi:DNA polymerase-3 subunit delta
MIFFLYGEDTYRSCQKLNLIKNRFLDKDKSGLNLVELDGSKILYKDLRKEFSASPFLCDKKLIVVENLLTQNKGAKLFEDLNKLIKSKKVPDFIFIIFKEDGRPDSRKALFKTLKKESETQEFNVLSGIQINQWIISEVKSRGGVIDNQAVNQLVAFVGGDLWQLSNEIDKLTSYNKKITIENVNLLVSAKADDNIFKIMDALSLKNKKAAMRLIKEQFRDAGKDLNFLMSMMARQFRILIQIKSFVDSSRNFAPTPSQIAGELKLHPFVVQKTLSQARNFEMAELKNIYSKLVDIDYKQKSGKADLSVLLDLLIAEI